MIKKMLKLLIKINWMYKSFKQLTVFLYRNLRLTEEHNYIQTYAPNVHSKHVQKKMNCDKAFMVASIQKSGTMMVLATLGNYFEQLIGQKSARLTALESREKYFSVNRYYFSQTDLPKQPYSNLLGFSNIYWAHIYPYSQDLHHFMGKAVVLYRNPLDTIISSYYYYEKNQNRKLKRRKPPQLKQVLEYFAHEFGRCYAYIKALKQADFPFFFISYEDIQKNKLESYLNMLTYMAIDIDQKKVMTALEFSDIHQVKQQELSGNTINKVQSGLHARSGQVGQWKSQLSNQDINQIETILKLYNIKLSEFTLDL